MADSIETDTVLALRERIHELQRELEEHKQAEHALIKRERHQQEITRLLELDQARLAAVLRHMPVGVWITDPNGRVIGTNEQAERIWAGAPSPLDNIWDYQAYIARGPGSDAPLEPEQYPLAVALRTGETVNTQELDIRRFDGTEGTVMASAAPILDLQGRVAGAVGVNVDISERKRLEEAVRESEARFRTMADGTPIMIWVTDANGRMEFVNKAYSEFFGVALEQVQSGTWQVLLHAEDRAGYVDVYMACLKEQRVFQAESRVLRGDGQWRWVASYGQPRFSERGEYLGMAGSSLDITERRQAEEALRESQSMLAEAERVSDAGSWRWNIQTGKLRWSDALYTVYGVNCETFEPSIEAFTDFIHPDDRQLVEQKIEQIRASGAAVDFEFRIVSGTGKIRVLKAIGQVTQFDGAGNPLIVIGANQDITEQKTAEQALRESEAKFHSAFENAAIGYALQTPEGRFVDANSAYCRLLGYSIGELNRLKFSDLLHPEDHAKHTPLVDQLLAGDIPDFVVESRYYRKDGKIVWVRKSCSLVKEASGEPKWMLAFIEDITEQKKAGSGSASRMGGTSMPASPISIWWALPSSNAPILAGATRCIRTTRNGPLSRGRNACALRASGILSIVSGGPMESIIRFWRGVYRSGMGRARSFVGRASTWISAASSRWNRTSKQAKNVSR
jgi:PAS domain S-box-containing protein